MVRVGDSNGNDIRCCERLDQATNSWVRGPDMLSTRTFFGLGVVNGELWAVGGSSPGSGGHTCERLNTVTGVWVPGPDMTAGRSAHSVAEFCGELWAVGGAADITSCERLDKVSNQ